MHSPLFFLFYSLFVQRVYSNETVYVNGKVMTIVESVETNCDHDVVEYFHKVPGTEMLYTFRVARETPTFAISIIIRALTSQRIMYQIKKVNGCQFLNNPLMSKAFSHTYQAIVANRTIFRCPIAPKVYFLKNMAKAKVIPSFHPVGRYQVNVQMQTSLSSAPFVMEIVWKYNVIHLK